MVVVSCETRVWMGMDGVCVVLEVRTRYMARIENIVGFIWGFHMAWYLPRIGTDINVDSGKSCGHFTVDGFRGISLIQFC